MKVRSEDEQELQLHNLIDQTLLTATESTSVVREKPDHAVSMN